MPYRHEDENRAFARGRGAARGWGTHIERGPRYTPLLLWFDYLDRDVALYGRRTDYREWRDLTSMPQVLDQLTTALAARIQARDSRSSDGAWPGVVAALQGPVKRRSQGWAQRSSEQASSAVALVLSSESGQHLRW